MKLIIRNDKVQFEENNNVNSSTINHYLVDLEFDEKWSSLNKKAILLRNDVEEGEEIAVINNQIYLDVAESGKYFIGFVGFDALNDTKVYQVSTNLLPIFINKGAGEVVPAGKELPTLTEWEKYIKQIQDICDGVVISEITEEIEGLNHIIKLHYTNGEYFEFTIKDGKKGETGEAGYTPIKGIDYFDGKDGKDGENGKDALINGVNILEIEGGKNISIAQTDDTLIINNNYEFDDSEIQANIETLSNSINEIDGEIVSLENAKQDRLTAGANITITESNVISAKAGLNISVVDTLPQTGSTDTIYLVADEKTEDDNIYLEYIWVNNKWELIGSTKVDLTDYVDKALLSQTLEDYAQTEYVDEKAKNLNDRIDDIDNKLGTINTQLAELTDVEVE